MNVFPWLLIMLALARNLLLMSVIFSNLSEHIFGYGQSLIFCVSTAFVLFIFRFRFFDLSSRSFILKLFWNALRLKEILQRLVKFP